MTEFQERKLNTVFSLHSFCNRVNKLTPDQKAVIEKTGFGNLLDLPPHDISKLLMSELMDHWNPEDNCFVLPPGKLSITLQDVVLILGIPVTGNPVVLNQDEPFSDIERHYKAQQGRRKVTVEFLEHKLDQLGDSVDEEFIRTFLLYIFGAFLFVNTNKTVDSRYLHLLKDLDSVCHFNWGQAMLECLHFWLDSWKSRKVSYVGGCLVFLLIWCYEHIDIGRPKLIDSNLYPRICRWQINKALPREFVKRRFCFLQDHQIIKKLQPTKVELKVDHVVSLFLGDKSGKKIATEELNISGQVGWKEKIEVLQSENRQLKEKNMNLKDDLKVATNQIAKLEGQNMSLDELLTGAHNQIAIPEKQSIHMKNIIGGASDTIHKLKI
ncbi:hypothetical protein Tsubulata_025854 [Turnera subulata]|uniref:Aminotransferase-like plant mobile domain-containing protein n=1 Tax=Turnera subulata TaxID=218843 RepID=A0A9Q0F8Q0_9ROSI|nr:hypothetical protein Tsubulata_025854 [Turnera subulata]